MKTGLDIWMEFEVLKVRKRKALETRDSKRYCSPCYNRWNEIANGITRKMEEFIHSEYEEMGGKGK